jgi:hypothetical protein
MPALITIPLLALYFFALKNSRKLATKEQLNYINHILTILPIIERARIIGTVHFIRDKIINTAKIYKIAYARSIFFALSTKPIIEILVLIAIIYFYSNKNTIEPGLIYIGYRVLGSIYSVFNNLPIVFHYEQQLKQSGL